MGFPQLPTWVSNFVKNIPRAFPTEVVSSAAKAIAQTMPPDQPVAALMPEHDPCADLALEELAQMPMELIDPEGRKNWCRDLLEQKRLASLPQPDPLAVFNRAIPVPDTPIPSDGKTDTPFTYRSTRDLLKRDTSGFLPLLLPNTGGSSFTPDLLHNTPQEGQAREFQENLNHGLNVIRNRGQNNTPDSPPGGGSPGFSGQIVVDGIIVAIERNGEQYPINAEWYWNRYGADGDKPFFRPGDPLGWNDPAPQIQFGTATFDFHLPGLPSSPDLPKKQTDPDDFDAEEWLKNNQELGRLGLRMLFWPLDLLASAREYERDNNLGNLINLILSGLPIVGLLGDVSNAVGNLLRKIPGVGGLMDKIGDAARWAGREVLGTIGNIVDKEGTINVSTRNLLSGKSTTPLSLSPDIPVSIVDSTGNPLSPEEIRAMSQRIFGRELTPNEIAALGGGYFGDRIVIWQQPATTKFMEGSESIRIVTESSLLKSPMTRVIDPGEKSGTIMVFNEYFVLREEARGQGIGTRVVYTQTEAIQRLHLENQIGIGAAARGGDFTGYKVWAERGYDALLPPQLSNALPQEVRDTIDDIRDIRVSDLMKTEIGRKWWEEKGITLSPQFDITPDSRSIEILKETMKRQGIVPYDPRIRMSRNQP